MLFLGWGFGRSMDEMVTVKVVEDGRMHAVRGSMVIGLSRIKFMSSTMPMLFKTEPPLKNDSYDD
jgi:hypothetical protein